MAAAQENGVTKNQPTLEWIEGEDEHDNTTWAAQSCLHDEGVHFGYLITPTLQNNAVWWSVGESDSELADSFEEDEFSNLEAAKQACETLEHQILRDVKRGYLQ